MDRNPKLPQRTRKNNVIKKEYSYSDILLNEISLDSVAYIKIGKSDLNNNFDLLRKIASKKTNIRIKFQDWDSVLFIDDILSNSTNIECFLVDDGLLISRDYIDLNILKNINISIPLTYLMWGVSFRDVVKVYCSKIYNPIGEYINFTSQNGNEKILKEDLLKIRDIITQLKSFGTVKTSDKINLISDYIQSRTQFIEGYENMSSRGVFITPDLPENYPQAAMIESVLNGNHGKCVAISNFSTLLLNNPELNVEVETIFNQEHAWNKVFIDGKYYYFDNTWDITRTDDPSDGGLVTLSFSKKYNMFGEKTAQNIGAHVPYPDLVPMYNNGELSAEDYQQDHYSSNFVYPTQPFYKSYKKQ